MLFGDSLCAFADDVGMGPVETVHTATGRVAEDLPEEGQKIENNSFWT
jgi:hypothetical protein